MHKDINFAIVVFLALLLLAPASSGFGVSGAVFREDVSPGQELAPGRVSNNENESQDFTVEVYRFPGAYRGQIMEFRQKKIPASSQLGLSYSLSRIASAWERERRETLFLNGTVPEDVGSGGRYALVAIKTAPEHSEGVSVSTAIQVLVLLTIKDGDLIQTGEIKSLNASQSDSGLAVSLTLENTGNIHYRPLAQSVLKDQSGQVLAQGEVGFDDSSTILPTNSYLFEMNLIPEGGLSPGKYTVEGKVTLEDGTVLDSKETELEI